MDDNKISRIKDKYPYHDAVSQHQIGAAQARFDYLLARRDQINDRIRSGSLALNAASLVGVFTALSTDVIAKGTFGLSIGDFAYSACCFMVGLIGGVLGIVFESYRVPAQAATQFDRLSRQERYRGSLNNRITEKAEESFLKSMEDVHELPPCDFEQSKMATFSTNFSGGAWIAGMLLPLWKVGSLIVWTS
jgi:hypothetical protein